MYVMPEGYWVKVRKIQKQQLLDFVKANHDKPMKQILALFSLKTGLKVSTLQVYINELKDANLIIDER